ncbi:nucleotidyltransferase [Marispirochaeta sp.]|jgi:hypothetical protein|uniref:nucleotidyltransferase n=1 Tax=Marispirochaeta sp. TaxID=2038653 RepID=UPI0029C73925|nr:nucleotidyltransferase [Marispirochaeta sp.]
MDTHPDYKELLELFNKRRVEYVIVGAHALALYGVPRFTGDIDIMIRPTQENGECIIKALEEFGFSFSDLSSADFADPDKVIQLGYPPVRIDLITSISGLTWEQVDSGKTLDYYGDVPVNFIGRKELIINKRASGRKKDLADLESLGEE